MTKRRGKLPRVELLNVPSYRQGTFDSLCAYYSAAMMLSTLFPEYTRSFGEAARTRATRNVSDDPLISYYSNEDDRLVLAKWFYQGAYISRTTTILNKIMRADRRRARFACRRESAHDNTFRDVIAGSIDQGLPVMLGWNTPDYGDHAVLVIGYWEGREKWFLINDPAGGAKEMSWVRSSSRKRRSSKSACASRTLTKAIGHLSDANLHGRDPNQTSVVGRRRAIGVVKRGKLTPLLGVIGVQNWGIIYMTRQVLI